MKTMAPLFSLVFVALAAVPAQGQRTACVIADIAETGYARNLAGPGGTSILYVRGPVEIHCGAGTIVRADSAHSLGGELRLLRNVFYQDSTQVMTSMMATYYRDEGRLIARGDVVIRDRLGPSVVRGSELRYEKVMPNRPEALMVMLGRPRAYFYEAGTPPLPPGMEPSPGMRIVGGDTIPAALQVDANRLEMRGESRMLAEGSVQMIRESLRAFGAAADYDRAVGRLDLTGNARMEGEGYELFGDRITAAMPNEQLERVLTVGNGLLIGADLQVRAPSIDIRLVEGEVEQMFAVSRQDGVLAIAVARDFTLVGDSIQADAPGSVIRRISSVGNAFGERAADSASASLPEVIRTDWLRGDTIVGTFIRIGAGEAGAEDAAASDTARSALETLTATGSARSLYRMASTDSGADRPAVNYLTATRIGLTFVDGQVDNVDADGPVEGIHLEPIRAASAEGEAAREEGAETTPDATRGLSPRGPEASR